LKREDLNHTGAHKINNCIGQALLAKRMGKPRVIAETGAGSTASPRRRSPRASAWNASSTWARGHRAAGAERVPDEAARRRRRARRVGSKTLKDALNEAMRDWVTNVETTFYIIGTVAGPHPYPMMVRDFQSVIGRECLTQMPELPAGSPTR
jgi:tryptophan synthase beta chain